MNSHFTCNVTANDNCLSIEEVDEMTHFADDDCQDCMANGLQKIRRNDGHQSCAR